jgi:hypothetical protein
VDVARSEAVEADLERFIERQSARKVDPDEREELWKASVERYNARRDEEMRAARVEYHRGQASRLAATLDALVSYHEREAQKYLPKGATCN